MQVLTCFSPLTGWRRLVMYNSAVYEYVIEMRATEWMRGSSTRDTGRARLSLINGRLRLPAGHLCK